AWSEAAELKRQAAALERRAEAAEEASSCGLSAQRVEITRLDGYDECRPSTAAAVEQRLLMAGEQALVRLTTAASLRLATASGAEGLPLERQPEDRPELLGGAEVLRIDSEAESEVECDAVGVQTEVQTEVHVQLRAALESKKGLFIAALAQQAKSWQAQAFSGWGRGARGALRAAQGYDRAGHCAGRECRCCDQHWRTAHSSRRIASEAAPWRQPNSDQTVIFFVSRAKGLISLIS
ncbi:unnamed protein product, partial [Polarella glacialis]